MSEICHELHQSIHTLKLHSFPFNDKEIPLNGIYILFELGELAHGTNRIVRIGTHTGKDQLRSRLKQHFIIENKDRSIFRKNIGRALLNSDHDPFLEQWELDLTTHDAKLNHSANINFAKQKQVERSVTEYIQRNFKFVTFEVKTKEERLIWESRIISTVFKCDECKPSPQWLGLKSPKEKIRNGGLWLVNELNKKALSEDEFKELRFLLGQA